MAKKQLNPYVYTATLVRIIDADTLDCDIHLGFGSGMVLDNYI